MITFTDIVVILTIHTVFDWIFQTRWQAENKAHNWLALFDHVIVYTVGLTIAAFILFGYDRPVIAAVWAYSNGALHFMTDAITSRMTKKFYPGKGFWNTIGIDQLIHYVTLFGTYVILEK
jgi:hypothetical protein